MTVSQLKRLTKGAFELEITIPKAEVQKTYAEVIDAFVKETEMPGFRKGAAPKELVEKSLDKAKVYEEVIQQLVPHFYLEAVKEQGLKPVLNPKVQLKSAKENEDWSFSALSCERPEIKIDGYKEEIKKITATEKIWIPGKGDPGKKEEPDKDKLLSKIMDQLLTAFPIEPADLLVEEEANHSLARLVDQTQQLGITVEQYLASTGKTAESIKADYAIAAKRNLQVEFLLDAIARDLKTDISDEEVSSVISAAATDPDSKKNLDTPGQRASIKSILIRRKVLDSILAIS